VQELEHISLITSEELDGHSSTWIRNAPFGKNISSIKHIPMHHLCASLKKKNSHTIPRKKRGKNGKYVREIISFYHML